MKLNSNRVAIIAVIAFVLVLGVAVGGLVMIHYDLTTVRDDLATLHSDLDEVKTGLAGAETGLNAMNTDLNSIERALVGTRLTSLLLSTTGIVGDLEAIKTELNTMNNPNSYNSIADNLDNIEQDIQWIRLSGLR